MKDIKKNYITIQGWMIQDLNLKTNEAFVFALIFGFCQDQESEFTGSVKYVCTWLNCSKNTALKAIKSLVEKNLIIKKEVVINNVLFNKYSINFKKVNQICTTGSNIERGVQILNGGSAETERGVVQKLNPIILLIRIVIIIKKRILLFLYLSNQKEEKVKELILIYLKIIFK